MRKCAVCNENNVKSPELSFHRFPKNEEQRAEWKKACGLRLVLGSTLICAKHFAEESFLTKPGGLRKLNSLAKPSIFDSTHLGTYKRVLEGKSKFQDPQLNQDTEMILVPELIQDPQIKQEFELLLDSELIQNTDPLQDSEMVQDLKLIQNSKLLQDSEIMQDLEFMQDCKLQKNIQNPDSEPIHVDPKRRLSFTESGMLDHPNIISQTTRRWHPVHTAQLTVEHFDTPQKAKRNLEIIKKEMLLLRRKNKITNEKNRRLMKKLTTLTMLLKHLKQKDLISENAQDKYGMQ